MKDRRKLLATICAAPVVAGLAGCGGDKDGDVGAVEDLMREHGVLRRAILVFRESASRLRQGTRA